MSSFLLNKEELRKLRGILIHCFTAFLWILRRFRRVIVRVTKERGFFLRNVPGQNRGTKSQRFPPRKKGKRAAEEHDKGRDRVF